jgi:hypothetical protein
MGYWVLESYGFESLFWLSSAMGYSRIWVNTGMGYRMLNSTARDAIVNTQPSVNCH